MLFKNFKIKQESYLMIGNENYIIINFNYSKFIFIKHHLNINNLIFIKHLFILLY
jgi:hypothetical protein